MVEPRAIARKDFFQSKSKNQLKIDAVYVPVNGDGKAMNNVRPNAPYLSI